MPGTQPFSPDQIYCVYCHAIAAGQCAECGALCCGDCVELRMGWTVQRAVCRPCLRRLAVPRRKPRLAVATVVVCLAVVSALLLWLTQ